ncbi:hypothetical protein [Halarcobacter anaerophilus]|uniref:Antitoxin n=1 Tax=Halarcobacter anaerophilus TaxID=877500 RepID=A0A4Q0Y3G8_9BACT|nr:hypothetical protein [Halarcobacter anaerophilus]QDF27679.1 hypothetical protein AANAER_0168 [Halarcobacter anaerophilus]RXJ64025.1 hypothetical protein CRV06_03540 [Halarcobacter anaerophilus]
MEPLQYTSKEMFSSTELIRKNKKIFDKLTKEEIDKAVILRDGKPSFMLLEFSKYEELMTEYLKLKNTNKNSTVIKKPVKKVYEYEDNIKIIESEHTQEEIDEEEYKKALEEIEKLEIEDKDVQKEAEEKKEPLKEFWE